MSTQKPNPYGLYDPTAGSDSCGVGFITRKDGEQTHEILQMAHSALCTVPHRGGMSAEGVGDGALERGLVALREARFFVRIVELGEFGGDLIFARHQRLAVGAGLGLVGFLAGVPAARR